MSETKDLPTDDTFDKGTSREVDLSKYFPPEVLQEMSRIKKNSCINKVQNYWKLKELGELIFFDYSI